MTNAPMANMGIEERKTGVDTGNRNGMIAAAVILAVFGLLGFYMPVIMLAVAEYSVVAAGVFAALFVLAFFAVFWLRGRYRGNRTP